MIDKIEAEQLLELINRANISVKEAEAVVRLKAKLIEIIKKGEEKTKAETKAEEKQPKKK